MSTKTLPKGSYIFDTAGKPDYKKAADAGYTCASLYPTGWYRCTQGMVDDALGYVGSIQWNQEAVGNEGLQGYDGGRRMAEMAIPAIENFGWKINESPIIYSLTDVGISVPQLPIVRQAYRACWERSWAGGYGPIIVMFDLSEAAPDDFILWHWGGDYVKGSWPPVYQDWPYIHCQQVYPAQPGFGVMYDHNYSLKDMTVWTGPGDDHKPPVIKEKVMADFRHDSHGQVFEISHGYRWPMTGDYYYDVLNGRLYGSPAPNPNGDGTGPVSYPVRDDAKLLAIPVGIEGGGGGLVAPHSHPVTGTAS